MVRRPGSPTVICNHAGLEVSLEGGDGGAVECQLANELHKNYLDPKVVRMRGVSNSPFGAE